jgi:hypothetical protein
MNIKKIVSAVALTGFLVSPFLVLAEITTIQTPKDIFVDTTTLLAKLNTITSWVFTILLVVAGLMLIVSGFFYITAAGDPEKIKKAKQMLINALIGVAVALAARGIVSTIQSLLEK